MTTIGTATAELADGLRTAFAAAVARAPFLAPLFALILARLDAAFRQLDALFAAWQSGTLPRPAEVAPTVPAATKPLPAITRPARARTPSQHPRRRVIPSRAARPTIPATPRATQALCAPPIIIPRGVNPAPRVAFSKFRQYRLARRHV